ncbi:MAG: helix-turn-helix domain-containing protein [Acidobacteriota bacterium]|nr:helix-turn-helix domain-containing protein [Acidobacteriota bacterium]
MSLETKQLARVEKAAEVLNVDKQRMYELARGTLPSGVVIRIGRQVRFDLDALQQWIASGGTREGARRDAAA